MGLSVKIWRLCDCFQEIAFIKVSIDNLSLDFGEATQAAGKRYVCVCVWCASEPPEPHSQQTLLFVYVCTSVEYAIYSTKLLFTQSSIGLRKVTAALIEPRCAQLE